MENISQFEIILSSSNTKESQAISRALAKGKLRKLATRIYTSNLTDPPEIIVKRNSYFILGKLFPNAIISHRSALEGGISKDGIIFLSYKYNKFVELPGLTVRLLKSKGSIENDIQFFNHLYISSRPRAFLENMQSSRGDLQHRKSLSAEKVEARLEKIITIYGVGEINKLRDQASIISPILKMEKEFKILDKVISALLGKHDIATLKTKQGKSRAEGFPYDPYRVELFAILAAKLQAEIFPQRHFDYNNSTCLKNLSFFESYFSNFIEGTEFEIDEAADIIFHNKIIANRVADSHDILGTYKIVSSMDEMCKPINELETLIKLLKSRHILLMEGHPEKKPGFFKDIANRAGNTVFVQPENVIGTLKKGFELYTQLEPGLARAIYSMFFISEIHPFLDGNGRIARIMMNAELTQSHLARIIIPTVYREDYLLSLRRFSKQSDPEAYIKMMLRAYEFTSRINFSGYEIALNILKNCHAFMLPHEGKLIIPRS